MPSLESHRQLVVQRPLRGAAFAAAGTLHFLWACSLPVAVAFDKEAHDAIGMTTDSALDREAAKQVKRLLGGQEPSDVAGWGHEVDDSYPGMEKLHFQMHTGTVCKDYSAVSCPDNVCLVDAIKHFYSKIIQDEGRTPEATVEIDHSKWKSSWASRTIQYTDADRVKMLINLLGDLHQPMHLGFESDGMGKNIQVKFRGNVMTLYDFWDKHIGEVVRKDESNFWLGGWTHVGRVASEFEADKAEWKKVGAFKMFEKWADETAKFGCEKAYKLSSGRELLTLDPPAEIDEATYQEMRSAFLRQILLAGERTAVVLNDILDDKGAKKLSSGSDIKTEADLAEENRKRARDEARKQRHANQGKDTAKPNKAPKSISAYPNAWRDFLTNLMIAVVFVPLFLLAANHATVQNFNLDARVILKWLETSHGASQSSGPQYAPRGMTKRDN